MHKTTLKERREKKQQSLAVHNARSRGRGSRVKYARFVKKMIRQQSTTKARTAAATAAKLAVTADPSLANLTDEQLAARNLAAAGAYPVDREDRPAGKA